MSISKRGVAATIGPPPIQSLANTSIPTKVNRSSISGVGRTSLVEAAIASVVYPVRSNGLIDILSEVRPPLPVEIPPLPEIRLQQAPQQKLKQPKHSVKLDEVVPLIEGDNTPNPFTYPKNVEQFVVMLDEFKAQDRERQQNIPTLMKGTKGYKQSQLVLQRIKPFLQPQYKASLAQDYKKVVWRAQNGLGINHLQKVSRKMHSEYIMQRKEIYYLRRAVRARKIALELLKQSKDFEEECLGKYEWLTNFTQDAFETFLRENDETTQKAAKKAEATLKEKLDKSLEVRQLSININQLKSDVVGTNESLRECKSYMRFLDDIAREIMRKDEEEEQRAKRREQQVKEQLVDYLKQGMTLKEAKEMVQRKARDNTEEMKQQGKSRAGSWGGGGGGLGGGGGGLGGGVSDSIIGGGGESPAETDANLVEVTAAGRNDFIGDLVRAVRRNIGIPEEFTDPPPEPEPKGKKAKREFRRLKKLARLALPTADQIAASLVQRNECRLNNVTAKHEKVMFGLELPTKDEIVEAQRSREDENGREDQDGYNEVELLNSLELVTGDEDTDRRELANLSFTRPSQLMAIYSDMEDANLSLIQHSQGSEELLEKVQQEISKTRKQLNHQGKLLRDEISSVEANIEMDEERAKALEMLLQLFTGGNYDVRKQQKLYRILQKHITKVYQAAVGSVEHHLNPTMMLTSVEKNFEDLVKEIQAIPNEVVLQISRELDKERREVERVEQINKKKEKYEERKSRSIARAEAPTIQKKGRPLLPRSRPPKTIIRLPQAELEKKAEEDEFNYFFGP